MLGVILVSIALLGASGPESRERCYGVLVAALKDNSPWIRAHAGEALVQSGRRDPALDVFRPLADSAEPKYRVVVWRILARAEPDPAEQRRYVDRIRKALFDRGGPDQTHAMEALAKLHEPIADDAELALVREIADGGGPMSPFAVWRLEQAKQAATVARLITLLRADDAVTRARAAYVLGRIRSSPESVSAAVSGALKSEPADSPARVMLRVAGGVDSAREMVKDAVGPATGRYFAAMFLAERGTPEDRDSLSPLLNDGDADVRVAAAFALLQIEGRARPATGASK